MPSRRFSVTWHYRVPAPVKAHYTRLWRHVRPKMLAVLSHGDAVEIGWASAVMTNELTQAQLEEIADACWRAVSRPE